MMERTQTKAEAERKAESYSNTTHLFMIHHIDSPRRLEWWRQSNIGVCFIWYSVLTCGAEACWLVVLCYSLILDKLQQHHKPPMHHQNHPTPQIHPHPPSISVRLLVICFNVCALKPREEKWTWKNCNSFIDARFIKKNESKRHMCVWTHRLQCQPWGTSSCAQNDPSYNWGLFEKNAN